MFFSPTGLQSNLSPRHIGFYPWENKPPAASVPDGTRITTIFGTSGMSDWHTRGGYWVPVSGRAVVYSPNTNGVTAQSSTLQVVAGIPGWRMPADLADTPGIYIEGNFVCTVTGASNSQMQYLEFGTDGNTSAISALRVTSVDAGKILKARAFRVSDTLWERPSLGYPNAYSGVVVTYATSVLTGSPIRLRYQGGSTAGTETLTVHSFSIAIGLG